jgi:hypothetical protein
MQLPVVTLALLLAACSRADRPASITAPSAAKVAAPPTLPKVTTGNLCDAYSGGGADAIYSGKRYTLVGKVVSLNLDAGASQVVLGSKLQPVVVTGIDPGATNALVIDGPIEIDCTITGAVAEIPRAYCGPNGQPRPVSPPP